MNGDKAGMSWCLRTGLGIILSFCAAGLLHAQLNHGIIEGIVTDPAGAAVANASVTVTSVDTGVANPTRTNSTGYYRAGRPLRSRHALQVIPAERLH